MAGIWKRAALAVALSLAAIPAGAETLTDALIAAYRNSNLLDQNRALLRAQDEGVAQAVARLRPVISYALESAHTRTQRSPTAPGTWQSSLDTQLALQASLVVFDFGRNALAVEQAKETVLATREALVNLEQQVLLDAVSAYVGVRLAEAKLDLGRSNVRVIQEELRAAQDRFEVGEITRTDVALTEARLAAARANLASAEGDLLVARESYLAAIGAYPGRLTVPPAAPMTARSLEEARGLAQTNHPLIRQAQREVTISELGMARAQANLKPSISFQAQVSQDDRGLGQEVVGLTLSQTIYQGGGLSAAYRAAIAQRDAARAALLQAGVDINESVGVAWSAVQIFTASIEASRREIEAAQAAYDGVVEEARLGARTSLDVLDAEQDLLDARVSLVEAEAGRYEATYRLLSAMGLLTVEHLKLGVPTYDPAAYYNAVKNAPALSAQGARLDRILGTVKPD